LRHNGLRIQFALQGPRITNRQVHIKTQIIRQTYCAAINLKRNQHIRPGKSNREGRSYDELIERYQAKLANGSKASGAFIPNKVDLKKGQKLKEKLKNEVLNLCLSIEKISEEDLDYYVLPHPILGKLTLREMLYFTIYHVKHHEKQIRS
jgi:hypothetical protein